MSLADYLSRNYLQSDKDKKKEKKKKEKKEKKSVVVDDGMTLKKTPKTYGVKGEVTSGILSHTDSSSSSAPAPKVWKVVGSNEVVTAQEELVRYEKTPMMASGAKAGLQTGSEVAAQMKAKEDKEKEMLESMRALRGGKADETVYRDASGRKIDMKTRLEERKRRREDEEMEKERKKKEMNMGLVQKIQLEEERKKLASAAVSGLSKYANDKDINDELRKKELEEDPMMSFKPQLSKKHVSLTGRKLYQSGFPENRFGIVAGHRWDGVDRSNGFERRWFKQQEAVERKKTLSYTMQEDY